MAITLNGTTGITTPSDNISGNLAFTGTGNRITGDFSNATQVNRVMFQTSTANGNTALSVIPNGTGTNGNLNLFNNSDPTNCSLAQLTAQSTEISFRSGIAGTGTYLPMTFNTAGSERARIDTSGNVGIGTASPTAKLSIEKSADAASPSRTPADYSIRMTAAQSNTYNGGICVSESTFVNAAITPVDTGASGAQGWAFITGNNTTIAEAARIESSGNLLVGTATALANVAKIQISAGTGASITTETTGTSATDHVNFRNANGKVGTITTSGTATAYNTSSDYRLKDNVAPMTDALAKVALLKPVTYKWNIDGSDGQGFIAHELDEVVQGCVTGEKDAVDSDGNPVHQGIDTSFLVATLTAAIQEQQALITSLTDRIAALEAR